MDTIINLATSSNFAKLFFNDWGRFFPALCATLLSWNICRPLLQMTDTKSFWRRVFTQNQDFSTLLHSRTKSVSSCRRCHLLLLFGHRQRKTEAETEELARKHTFFLLFQCLQPSPENNTFHKGQLKLTKALKCFDILRVIWFYQETEMGGVHDSFPLRWWWVCYGLAAAPAAGQRQGQARERAARRLGLCLSSQAVADDHALCFFFFL